MTQQPVQQYGAQEPIDQPVTGDVGTTGIGRGAEMGGQQFGGTGGQMNGGVKLEEAISDEMRVALHDFGESARVCEWCADQCIDEGPEMAECVRLCRDVADIATLNVEFLSRDSIFGQELAELFVTAAEECAGECAKHSHRHCQECAEVLTRAAQSTRTMLDSFAGGQSVGTGIAGTPGADPALQTGSRF